MADRVGQQLGNYRLLRLLGQGAFAEVYLGEHIHLKSQAAIKLLHTFLTEREVMNFQREAQRLVGLMHPNIVRVFDFAVDSGIPFLVMEYAPNGSLRDLHPQGSQVSLDTVVSYVKQIASALQYVHDHKLVHRDVKPANMLVGSGNNVLLSDVGLAVIAHSEHSLSTQPIGGTVAYMAPEQFRGTPRRASDQYALGIVVYEWLCGERPFTGDHLQIAFQHAQVPPPPLREKLPTISPALEEVVLRALAKDPQQRFANMQAFATALELGKGSQSALSSQEIISPSLPMQSTDINMLYRDWVKAHAKGNVEHALSLLQEILYRDPTFENGEPISRMKELLRQQVKEVRRAGKWDQEITLWEAVLKLDPLDTQAEKNLRIAEKNKRYAPIYEAALQSISENDLSTARNLLKEVWHNAPYYNDPAGAATKVGMRVPLLPPISKENRVSWITSWVGFGVCFLVLIAALLVLVFSGQVSWQFLGLPIIGLAIFGFFLWVVIWQEKNRV